MTIMPDPNGRPLGFWETIRVWWAPIAFMLTFVGVFGYGYLQIEAQSKTNAASIAVHLVEADRRDEMIRFDREKISELTNKGLILEFKLESIQKSLADSYARGEATRNRLGTLENDNAGLKPYLEALSRDVTSIVRRLDKMEDRNTRLDDADPK